MHFRADVLYCRLLEDVALHDTDKPLTECSPSEVATRQLKGSILKKFNENTKPDAEEKAISKFVEVNDSCKRWELSINDIAVECVLGELKYSLWKYFNDSDGCFFLSNLSPLFEAARVGPGVSLGAVSTDFYSKMFASTLTTTSPLLYRNYRDHTSKLPTWAHAEETRRFVLDDEIEYVTGNKMSFVPKNDEILRSICVEPSLNMFYQLGLATILQRRLNRRLHLDISDQATRNKRLAKIGSRDDSFVTIDLESASDSFSLTMMKYLLPKEMYNLLSILRSKTTIINGKTLELNMMSTMGNGFTFPLMTTIFAFLVRSVYRFYGLDCHFDDKKGCPTAAVFGDDIIVLKRANELVQRTLAVLGFKVNTDKTFVIGPFRESCGGDYFNGHQVRGIYIKSMNSLQDRDVAVNKLVEWSTQHNILLSRTIRYLLSLGKHYKVPVWENDDAGIRVPYTMVSNLKSDPCTQSIKYMRHRPRQRTIGFECGIRGPRELRKKLIYNPSGLMISLLQGCVVNGRISVRQDRVRYVAEAAIAPNWDFISPEWDGASLRYRCRNTDIDWRRWKYVATVLLS